MSPNGAYPVHLTPRAVGQVRWLLQRASEVGAIDRVKVALREVQSRLRVNPSGWGDPSRHLPDAGMLLFHRVYDELSVLYGIHEARHQVWLFRIVPVLNHPAGLREQDGS